MNDDVCFSILLFKPANRNTIQYSVKIILSGLIHIIPHPRLSYCEHLCCFLGRFVYLHKRVDRLACPFCVNVVLMLWQEEKGHISPDLTLWSGLLCSLVDRRGFAWASLTAKKQAVPSPATTSTEHRSTQKSVRLISLFPLSAGHQAGHLRVL